MAAELTGMGKNQTTCSETDYLVGEFTKASKSRISETKARHTHILTCVPGQLPIGRPSSDRFFSSPKNLVEAWAQSTAPSMYNYDNDDNEEGDADDALLGICLF